jgi:hypothetical protein
MQPSDEPLIKASDCPVLKVQSLDRLLPNPKASDEPLPTPSVHPTVRFEYFGHRTHLMHVEMSVSVHPTL